MRSVIIVALLVAVNKVSKGEFFVAGTNEIYSGLCVKFRIFLSGFKQIFTREMYFHKSLHYSNFKKIRAVGVEPIRADRQTDMTKLLDAFHDYVKAISNGFPSTCSLIFQILKVVTSFLILSDLHKTQIVYNHNPISSELFGAGYFENKLYGEMNSVKKHNYKIWLNDGVY